MSKSFLKKGENVLCIAGDDKGKSGVILEINKKESLVKVSGLALKKRSSKITETNKDNFIQIERFIHMSNIKPLDNKTKTQKQNNKKNKK